LPLLHFTPWLASVRDVWGQPVCCVRSLLRSAVLRPASLLGIYLPPTQARVLDLVSCDFAHNPCSSKRPSRATRYVPTTPCAASDDAKSSLTRECVPERDLQNGEH